jgi:hypothetical protein
MDSTIDQRKGGKIHLPIDTQRKGVKYIIYQEFIYNKIYTPMS